MWANWLLVVDCQRKSHVAWAMPHGAGSLGFSLDDEPYSGPQRHALFEPASVHLLCVTRTLTNDVLKCNASHEASQISQILDPRGFD
jgi:hypothetical protein